MRALVRLGITLIFVAIAGAATPSAQAGPMFTGLGYLGGEPDEDLSRAHAVSADGSVVVGYASTDLSFHEAYRWTQAGGMVGLGFLPGGIGSSAEAVSPDGSIIVGYSHLGGDSWEAFIWDEARGMRNLQDVLANDYGLDLSGWMLSHAYDLSSDGRTIVGVGINPGGSTEAWIAVISEPSTALLLACGVAGLAVRSRRRAV